MIQDAHKPYRRAESSERIRHQLADFVLRQKSSLGVKTGDIARQLGLGGARNLSREISSLNSGDLLGWEKLIRLVEALDHEVEIVIKPRETEREAA